MSRSAWEELPFLQGGGLVVTPMSCSGLWARAAHCSLVAVPRRGELGSHPRPYPGFFPSFPSAGRVGDRCQQWRHRGRTRAVLGSRALCVVPSAEHLP